MDVAPAQSESFWQSLSPRITSMLRAHFQFCISEKCYFQNNGHFSVDVWHAGWHASRIYARTNIEKVIKKIAARGILRTPLWEGIDS